MVGGLNMLIQTMIVGVIVAVCAAYALWMLLPQALRKPLANQLLRLPLPVRWSVFLQKASQRGAGCGCDGCDKVVKPAAVQPIVFQPRKKI